MEDAGLLELLQKAGEPNTNCSSCNPCCDPSLRLAFETELYDAKISAITNEMSSLRNELVRYFLIAWDLQFSV